MKRDLEYREKLKVDISKQILDIQADTKEQKTEKYDLGIKLLKFFQYEEDPEFTKLFDEFCRRRGKGERNGEENSLF